MVDRSEAAFVAAVPVRSGVRNVTEVEFGEHIDTLYAYETSYPEVSDEIGILDYLDLKGFVFHQIPALVVMLYQMADLFYEFF